MIQAMGDARRGKIFSRFQAGFEAGTLAKAMNKSNCPKRVEKIGGDEGGRHHTPSRSTRG
jgi:hypothetical protein